MSEFELHRYSAMAYESRQIITFSENPSVALPDVDEEMKFHTGVSSVKVSNLTQTEFDCFIEKYGDRFKSIYFFHNTKVRDLSALSALRNVNYLLFYHVRGNALWDMRENKNLKGILISDSRKMIYDLEPLQHAPGLEELILLSSDSARYPVRTIAPLRNCPKLARLMIEFNTEDKSFRPGDFAFADVFRYKCDRMHSRTS